VFPLSRAGARPRSNRNAAAHTELWPRSWEFFNFHCKYSYYAYNKKNLKCRAIVRSWKNCLLRAVAGPRSCKKKLEGTLVLRDIKQAITLSTWQSRRNVRKAGRLPAKTMSLCTTYKRKQYSKICNIRYWIIQKSLLIGKQTNTPIIFKYIFQCRCCFFLILCAPCYVVSSGENNCKVQHGKQDRISSDKLNG
jgi:hypothetical protein